MGKGRVASRGRDVGCRGGERTPGLRRSRRKDQHPRLDYFMSYSVHLRTSGGLMRDMYGHREKVSSRRLMKAQIKSPHRFLCDA